MGIFRHPGITLQLQSKIRLAAPGGQDQEQHVDYLGHRGVALLGAGRLGDGPVETRRLAQRRLACAGLLQADDPRDHELEITVAEHNAFPKPTTGPWGFYYNAQIANPQKIHALRVKLFFGQKTWVRSNIQITGS